MCTFAFLNMSFFPGQNRCFTAHLSARGLQKQKGLFDLHRQTSVHLENTVLTADPHCAIFNCIFFLSCHPHSDENTFEGI